MQLSVAEPRFRHAQAFDHIAGCYRVMANIFVL